jgi:hypothetical protein
VVLPLEEGEYVLQVPTGEIWKVIDVEWDGMSSTLYLMACVHPAGREPPCQKFSDALVNVPEMFRRLNEMEVIAWAAK